MTQEKYLDSIKDKLYGESTVAKIWGVALPSLSKTEPPTEFPHYFKNNKYIANDVEYWTSGFFPGSVYALLERNAKYPDYFPSKKIHPLKLESAAKWWAEPLVAKKTKTDHHDLGFMIMPPFEREYNLSGSEKAKDVIVTAANSLATRFDEKVGCIRSWDKFAKDFKPSDYEKDLIVIIDNMCNLSLLYEGAELSGDLRLSSIATRHAETTLEHHFRNDMSAYHCIIYDRETGKPSKKINVQGYADESSWTRGQAWALLGFSEAYSYTKIPKFLDAAKSIADYYLSHLTEDGVPPYDFMAPDKHVKDVSSAMAAGVGMLNIYECTKEDKYLQGTLKLVYDCTKLAMNEEAKLNDDGSVVLGDAPTILNQSTITKNPEVPKEYLLYDLGLVYADYYFLTIGNKLLELGLYK